MQLNEKKKEKSMTKRPPSAMRSQLSKICHLLIVFGCVKIALLVALASGYTLPEFEFLNFLQSPQETLVAQDNTIPTDNSAETDTNSVTTAQSPAQSNGIADENVNLNADNIIPQGSAAVRAAEQYQQTKPTEKVKPQVAVVDIPMPKADSNAQTVLPQKPVQENPSWWSNILSATSLPFPRLGVDQVAYAATLDSPPPPSIPSSSAPSPFSPPQQNPSPKPTVPTQPVLPAGTAGPQIGVVQPNPLVPNPNPPAPNVNTYVSPEDPSQKQQELARREQELLMLKKQTEQRLNELKAAERKVQEMLKEAKNVESTKIEALTNMYVNMKAKQAAKALESMEEDIAVKILLSMRPKQAGEILSYTNPSKTAKFTELLSRMQLGN